MTTMSEELSWVQRVFLGRKARSDARYVSRREAQVASEEAVAETSWDRQMEEILAAAKRFEEECATISVRPPSLVDEEEKRAPERKR